MSLNRTHDGAIWKGQDPVTRDSVKVHCGMGCIQWHWSHRATLDRSRLLPRFCQLLAFSVQPKKVKKRKAYPSSLRVRNDASQSRSQLDIPFDMVRAAFDESEGEVSGVSQDVDHRDELSDFPLEMLNRSLMKS